MLVTLLTIIPIIVGFGFLVFMHELGHFLAAKWAGIRTEAFAVGMGAVACSYRKGVGFRWGTTTEAVRERTGADASRLTDEQLRAAGLGETEYSLRWLPIGGFVKMQGQDDMDPGARSDAPRSYQNCPVGKRLIVIGAGVVMNAVVALAFFMVAFLQGVRFDAPVVGGVDPTMPAGTTVAENAAALGVDEPGLRIGDHVVRVDGGAIDTFTDVYVAAAMARPGRAIELEVERPGVAEPLRFRMTPRRTPGSKLLAVGVYPAPSATLIEPTTDEGRGALRDALDAAGLAETGIDGSGWVLAEVNGAPVETAAALDAAADELGGRPVPTTWRRATADGAGGDDDVVRASIPVEPRFDVLRVPTDDPRVVSAEPGLLGLAPVIRVASIMEESGNVERLEDGDLIARVGDVAWPHFGDLRRATQAHRGRILALEVLRDGALVEVAAVVDDRGLLGIATNRAYDVPRTTRPIERRVPTFARGGDETVPTPLAGADVPAGSLVLEVAGRPVEDWAAIRAALLEVLLDATDESADAGPVTVTLLIDPPGAAPARPVELAVGVEDAQALARLGWSPALSTGVFTSLETTLTAHGNPLRAMSMGVRETHQLMLLTLLTLDRLVRGSVAVTELRGPVGIIDLGTRVWPRGFTYFLFFLGMISVNLAVLNALPLPILDGGHAVFLIYEKIRGRPPSVAFQNAATLAGLLLIGSIFLVTFYNDIARLITG